MSLAGYGSWGHKESDTTQQLSLPLSTEEGPDTGYFTHSLDCFLNKCVFFSKNLPHLYIMLHEKTKLSLSSGQTGRGGGPLLPPALPAGRLPCGPAGA